MKQIKFLHCADIHLDAAFTSHGTAKDRSSARRLELRETFKRVIHTARQERAQLLLISGDLYEHRYVRKSTIHFINDMFGQIPGIKVFIIPGNHDPYTVNSYYKSFLWNENVYILSGDCRCVTLEDMGVRVYGVGFESFYAEKSLVGGMEPADSRFINLLLVHGTVDMNFGNNAYNPMSSQELAQLGMDYIALGHFHNRTVYSLGSVNAYNPGSPEPLGFDETGEHGVFAGTVTRAEDGTKAVDVRFIKLNQRFYENVEVSADGCGTDEQVTERVMDALSSRDTQNGLFCVTLKGFVQCGFRINTGVVQACFEDRLFYVRIKDETLAGYDFDEMVKEPGLRGLFVRKLYSLMDKAGDEQEKKRILKALYYGMEALDRGSIEL